MGCGGPYYYRSYTDFYHDTYETYYNLVYFKKGNETWGTPFDTTGWIKPDSTHDTITQIKIQVYPNPTGDQNIIVVIPALQWTSVYQLQIYSILGQKISETEVSNQETSIDMSCYSKGMYIIKLCRNNLQVGQQKLIKN